MKESARPTPLADRHRALKARMVPFAGYLMPLSYEGQIAEHGAVRTGLGLFDLSHMGEFRITGDGALAAVDALVTNRVVGTDPGQAVYSPMCAEDGGIVDDLIVYHLENEVLLVVNAANIDKDLAWVRDHLPSGVEVVDASAETALIAVQGPRTETYLGSLTRVDLASMETYTARRGEVAGIPALVSRTGYTGEDGFELYVAADQAGALWDRLREEGGDEAPVPVGLAARDTLRFEMGYCLYGNDIDETTTPLEAGLAWTVKLGKKRFVGREALKRQKEQGIPRRLVGLRPGAPRAIPRAGYRILVDGEPAGRVTSGTFSPSLDRGLALGYVDAGHAGPGSRVGIEIRNRVVEAEVVRPPFYTKGSRKAAPRKPKSS